MSTEALPAYIKPGIKPDDTQRDLIRRIDEKHVQVQRDSFLRALHPEGYRDLRAFPGTVTTLLPVSDLEGAYRFARENESRNVFFGVAPRNSEGKKLEHCVSLHALFVDIDFKDTPEAEARERLESFKLPPSAVVHSGGGLHVYWLLEQPVDLQNGGAPRAGELLRSLASELQGDLKAAEPARILRMPGSFNHKPAYAHSPPPFVKLESLHLTRRYSVDDWSFLPPPPPKPSEQARAEPLPQQIPDGQRNDTLFREGSRLRRLGWSVDEINEALRAINHTRCRPPLQDREVRTIADSCAQFEPAVDTFKPTETGDAEFFAECNRDLVRFDHRRGRWLLFDGNRWAPQTDG